MREEEDEDIFDIGTGIRWQKLPSKFSLPAGTGETSFVIAQDLDVLHLLMRYN